MRTICALASLNPNVALPVFFALGNDVLARAQSIPGLAPFSIGWPGYLITLLARNRSSLPYELHATVINVRSGYSRTNHSPTIEHLLRSHGGDRGRRGLTITFLYTSQFPGTPANDATSWGAILIAAVQLLAAGALHQRGIASRSVVEITASGILLSIVAGLVLCHQTRMDIRSARPVPADHREVILITSGNGSSDAVVVVGEGGSVKLEDIAAGRAGSLSMTTTIGIVMLLALWTAMLLVLTALGAEDAWAVLAVCALGTVHTTVAARTWRGGAALGFKFAEERKKVVHGGKVMQVLMEAEDVESGVGAALLAVFFPGPLRPKEEEWWARRKAGEKAV